MCRGQYSGLVSVSGIEDREMGVVGHRGRVACAYRCQAPGGMIARESTVTTVSHLS